MNWTQEQKDYNLLLQKQNISKDVRHYLVNLPLNIKAINISNKKLNNLPDLSRFTLLESLICSNNKLTTLGDLSKHKTLLVLVCNKNKLTALENLPDSLELISYFNNYIIDLPFILPSKLVYIFKNKDANTEIKYPKVTYDITYYSAKKVLLTILSIFGRTYLQKRNYELLYEKAKERMSIINKNGILIETIVKKRMNPKNIQSYLNQGYLIDQLYDLF